MRLRDGVSAGCGVAATALSIFAIGGRPRWAQLLVALAIAGALVPLITSRRVLGKLSPLAWLAGLAAVFCALQLIPLPHGVLDCAESDGRRLARRRRCARRFLAWPHDHARRARNSRRGDLFHDAARASRSCRCASRRRRTGRYRIVAVVAALCGTCAVFAWVHRLFDLPLYGVITDTNGAPLLSPLINGNQTACLMAVGAIAVDRLGDVSTPACERPRGMAGLRAHVCGRRAS